MVQRDAGPTHGVIYLPRKGVVIAAAKGHGCRVNGEIVRLQKGQVGRRLFPGRCCFEGKHAFASATSDTASADVWPVGRARTGNVPLYLRLAPSAAMSHTHRVPPDLHLAACVCWGLALVDVSGGGHACATGATMPHKSLKGCLVAAEIGKFVPDDRLQRLLRLVHDSMGIRNLFSRYTWRGRRVRACRKIEPVPLSLTWSS